MTHRPQWRQSWSCGAELPALTLPGVMFPPGAGTWAVPAPSTCRPPVLGASSVHLTVCKMRSDHRGLLRVLVSSQHGVLLCHDVITPETSTRLLTVTGQAAEYDCVLLNHITRYTHATPGCQSTPTTLQGPALICVLGRAGPGPVSVSIPVPVSPSHPGLH